MKKVKILTIVLAILLITMVAFGGIYVQKQNRMENKIKNYTGSMAIKGSRIVRLKVSDENEEVKTKENYQQAKKILEKRLSAIGVEEYLIRVNEETGEITVQIPENQSTDTAVSYIGTAGEFQIKDTETGEVLMNNSDIKLSNVLYGQGSSTSSASAGTTVYLNIEFTKDGAKKLEDISKTYVKEEKTQTEEETQPEGEASTEENNAEQTEAEEKKEKTITMTVDGNELMSTSFEEPLTTGKIQLSIGKSTTDNATLQGYVVQASSMATLLDNGNIPVKYEVDENQYVLSGISSEKLAITIYVIAAVLAILLITLIVRYKSQGAMAVISYIGLVSLFLLLIRYTNVTISIEGILGIAIVLLLNYVFTNKLLTKLKSEDSSKENIMKNLVETYKEFFIKIVPICIFVIVTCFTKWAPISSFGMIMFWGIALIAIYNFIVTNNIMKISASK